MPGVANPLPTTAVVGHLTQDQVKGLKMFWQEFYRLIEEAPKVGTGGAAVKLSEKEMSGGSIPKSDDAKEQQRAERETADARAAFAEFGSIRFLTSFWRFVAMDNPDVIALRFLRARKWNITAAVAMLASCIKWRMAGDVESIFKKGEEGMKEADGFIAQMSSGKTYTQGTDRYGRPVIYVHVQKHRTWDQSPKALEDFVIFQMESNRALFASPVDKVTMIFDMTGFGIRNMDWRCILFIVKCLEAYYPESLNVMLIHAAPWVFQGIWKLLGPMLDPVVRNKVEMTKTTEDLQVHIDKAHLVKALGGTSDWTWEYPPVVPGENAAQLDLPGKQKAEAERNALIADWVAATKDWIEDSGNGSDKSEKLRELAQVKMRIQYHALDKFERGRGAYHRHGNIVGNGLVHWDYPAVPGSGVEGEWEVQGYETCREQSLITAQKLSAEIKSMR